MGAARPEEGAKEIEMASHKVPKAKKGKSKPKAAKPMPY